MRTKKLARIEVWDDLECTGGSPLAALSDWEEATEVWRLDGREELTVQMSRQDPAFSEIQEERVLRLVYRGPGDGVGFRGDQPAGEAETNGHQIVVPSDPALHPTTTWTVEGWVYADVLPQTKNGASIFDNAGGAGNDQISAQVRNSLIRVNIGGVWDALTWGGLAARTWTHVAVVYDNSGAAGDARLYIDGVEVDSATGIAEPAVDTSDVWIGRRTSHFQHTLRGRLDDIRLWNVARTESEIRESRTQELTGSEAGLVGYWPMKAGEGTTVVDATWSGHDGTLTADSGADLPKWVQGHLDSFPVAEYDVRKVTDEKREDGVLVAAVLGQSPRYRLGRNADLMEQVEANGLVQPFFQLQGLTPAEHLSKALEFAPSYVTQGTVDPTDRVTLSYELDTPLEALTRLAEETGAELEVVRNGATDYQVNLLTQRGTGQDEAYLRADRNVTRLRHESDSRKQATRIYPVGAQPTHPSGSMAEHSFEVASVSGTDVTLAADDGRDPIRFDDQLDGLYLEKPGGTLTQVTDTVQSPQTVTVVDASGLVSGDRVTFRRNAAGDGLTYLEHPTGVATYGVKSDRLDRQDIPPVNNLVTNPDLSSWTAGVPDGWSLVGAPTTAEETGELARAGGSSAHLTMATDEGIETDALTVNPTEVHPNFASRIRLYVVSGSVRLEMVDVTNGDTYPAAASGTVAKTSVTGQWVEELGIDPAKVNFFERGTAQMRLRVVAEEAAEIYLDLAQLVNRAGLSEPLYPGRGSNDLWHAANDELDARGLPAHSYDVRAADLHRLDPDTYPHDEIVLGADVLLYDADLGLDLTTRVVEIARSHRTDTETRVVLSSAPDDLEGQLGSRGKKRMPPPPEVPPSEEPPSVDVDYDESESTATLKLSVFDPNNGQLTVEFQTRSGVGASWSATDERSAVANGATETKAVTLVEGQRSSIRYRVTGSNGVDTGWRTVDFDAGRVAEVESLTAWGEADGTHGADVSVDTDTDVIYLTRTTDGTEPADPTAANADQTVDVSVAGRSSEVTFTGEVPKGGSVQVKARGENPIAELGPVARSKDTRPADPGPDETPDVMTSCDITVTADNRSSDTMDITGSLGTDGVGPVQVRYRVGPTGAWSAWQSSPISALSIGADSYIPKVVTAQARDSGLADPSKSISMDIHVVSPDLGAVDDDGRIRKTERWSGDTRTPGDTDGDAIAGRGADDDLTGMEGGGWLDRVNQRIEDARLTGGKLSTEVRARAESASPSDNAIDNPDFELDYDGWHQHAGGGSVSVVSLADGKFGAKVVEVAGGNDYFGETDKYVPIDPGKVYFGEFWVRQTVDPGAGGSRVFAGVVNYKADKTQDTGRPNIRSYFVASGQTIVTADGWTYFSGFITGTGTAGDVFGPDTVYVRPMFAANYNNGDGTAQVAFLRFTEVNAREIRYGDGSKLEDLKPAESGADVTANKPQDAEWVNQFARSSGSINSPTDLVDYIRFGKGARAKLVDHGTTSGIITIDPGEGQVHKITMNGDVTLRLGGVGAGGVVDWIGVSVTIILMQDGTGGRTVTFDNIKTGIWEFPGGNDPALDTAANAVNVVAATFYQVSGVPADTSHYFCNLLGTGYA